MSVQGLAGKVQAVTFRGVKIRKKGIVGRNQNIFFSVLDILAEPLFIVNVPCPLCCSLCPCSPSYTYAIG